jgi:membrane protease YdiL (CAAX protease family)
MIETAAGQAPAPYEQHRAPWGVRDIIQALLVTILAMSGIFILLALLLSALDLRDDDGTNARVTLILLGGQLLLDLAAVGVAAGFSIAKYGLPAAAWGLVRPLRLKPWPIVSTLMLCYGVLWTYGLVTTLLGLDQLEPQGNIEDRLFDNPAVVPFAVAFAIVIAPAAEEMFFRGFLFHGLWPRLGMWGAALLSGLAFGAIHVTGVDKLGLVIPFAAIGALFARLVGKTGSLWNAIAAHCIFNSIGVLAYFVAKVAT